MYEAAAQPQRGVDGGSWLASSTHRAWATEQALRLFEFFQPTLTPAGRFVELDDNGVPEPTGCPPALAPQQNLLTVARAVHSYALGEMLGVPGCRRIVDAGLRALWEQHRDAEAGGYVAAVDDDGPVDTTKPAYGHAFVLVAASTALAAGHREAQALWDDALSVIDAKFWSEEDGASREAFDRGWHELEAYRGANSNMHLCESFLAAADVSGRADLAERATRIAAKLIDGQARSNGWLLPEHYTTSWEPRFDYNSDRLDDPFRPFGATMGHSIEWSRLVLSCGLATGGLADGWFVEAAESLFSRAVEIGWDERIGGFVYTVGWDGKPANPDHYWWPVAEAIAAAAYLEQLTGNADRSEWYEGWYRKFWDYAADVLIDHERGGWYPLFDAENHRKEHPWFGKPDIYHALQACLLPILPVAPSVAGAIVASGR
ncbi:MAG TPA: AGE family epimerase/isomerase [Acidimicrobiales bacterium]|nr:AGE family epimerase/isomerase [Acidimicrobiales bacterium]